MRLQIIRARRRRSGKGTSSNEGRKFGDIGDFVLIQAGYFDGSVTNGVYETYWFPDKEVAAGDYIVLYTKSGKMSDKTFRDVHSHFFYWGLKAPIWNRPNKCPVLMYAPDWESFKGEF